MTDRVVLKNEVLALLDSSLNSFGFKMSKAANDFTQKTDFGWNKYQIVFLEREKGWEIKPSLLVRFDDIENLYHSISDFEKKYQKGTPTIGIAIEDLVNDNTPVRFELTKLSEIDYVVKELLNLFNSIALPFFSKYNNLQQIDNLLNNGTDDTSITGDIFKGIKSLIVAKLTNRTDLEKIGLAYQQYYQKFANGFYLPEYNRLKELLNA